MAKAEVIHGDCLKVLPTLEAGSIDAVICDPPYPEIDRAYGRWTEAEWWELMMGVAKEVRRLLKPTGSAVFILQPNSRKAGSMRSWLFDFQGWVCREWNMVQDVYWWNTSTLPLGGSTEQGLTRSSLKHCVWAGKADCYRDQDAILWEESQYNTMARLQRRFLYKECPSRSRSETESLRDDHQRLKTRAADRGGATPFNVFPAGSDGRRSGGTHGHPASTPLAVLRSWTRYICPPGGTVLDPFAGSGTGGVACLQEGRSFLGVEKEQAYVDIARKRIAAEQARFPLFQETPG